MLINWRGKPGRIGAGAKDNNIKNLASCFHAQPTQILAGGAQHSESGYLATCEVHVFLTLLWKQKNLFYFFLIKLLFFYIPSKISFFLILF